MAWERKLMRTVRVQNDHVIGTLVHLITMITDQDGKSVNNVLGFPGILRGAVDTVMPRITHEMYLAAAQTIADLTRRVNLCPARLIKKSTRQWRAPWLKKPSSRVWHAQNMCRTLISTGLDVKRVSCSLGLSLIATKVLNRGTQASESRGGRY